MSSSTNTSTTATSTDPSSSPSGSSAAPAGSDHHQHENSDEVAMQAACDLLKLTGNTEQMQKLGCSGIPEGPTHLKTIPTDSQRGSEVDDQIAETLNYIMLALLLFVALLVIILCCCQMYDRMASRRAALRAGSGRAGSHYRTRGKSGCCGGTGTGASLRVGLHSMSYSSGAKYMPECHDCGYLNMV